RLDRKVEDMTEAWGVMSVQGPYARDLLTAVAPDSKDLPYFGLMRTSVAKVPVLVSRTGYTGDLGFEIWVPAADAVKVWDAVAAAGKGRAGVPLGMTALYMARIEAGLVLLDVDFHSSRFAWTDADRATRTELGLGWMLRTLDADDREFIGRDAIARELRDGTSRWRLGGLIVDWRDYDRIYDEVALVLPHGQTPIHEHD